MNRETFQRWLDGETDLMEHILDGKRGHDLPRQDQRRLLHEAEEAALVRMGRVIHSERRIFSAWYRAAAVACCLALMTVFLYMTAHITRYGAENPRAAEVAERYVERGLEETGAVNMVAGMILDYRAFDTLGESHVLFTALICVMILLRRDRKNMRTAYEDYYRIREEDYFPTDRDPIAKHSALWRVCPAQRADFPRRRIFGRGGPRRRTGDFRVHSRRPCGRPLPDKARFSVDRVFRAVLLQLRKGLCLFHGRQSLGKPYPERDAGRDTVRRLNFAARHCRRVGGSVHDVRLLQPVPAREYRRRTGG